MQTLTQGISFRLAKVGVMIALIVGSLMSGIQIYIDFQVRSDELNGLISRITESVTPAASRAVHSLDPLLADEVTRGVISHEFIFRALIMDEVGNVLSESSRPTQKSGTKWVTGLLDKQTRIYQSPLVVEGFDHIQVTIQFEMNMDEAYTSFYEQSLLIITFGLIRSFFLVLFLFFAFYYLLTKPLKLIANELGEINPSRPREKRLTEYPSRKKDELSRIASMANQMLDEVEQALVKRRSVENVLRKSEEHVKQIIDSLPVWVGARNRKGKFIFVNKAFADFLNSSPDQVRGCHLEKFA